jgi:hypothetical protein
VQTQVELPSERVHTTGGWPPEIAPRLATHNLIDDLIEILYRLQAPRSKIKGRFYRSVQRLYTRQRVSKCEACTNPKAQCH